MAQSVNQFSAGSEITLSAKAVTPKERTVAQAKTRLVAFLINLLMPTFYSSLYYDRCSDI